MTRLFSLSLFIALSAMVIAACTPPPPPPPRPTVPPSTPLSTELAPVPTSIPAGFSSENPIQLVIIPADAEAAAGRESELQALIEEVNDDVVVEVVFVETQPEAMALLCGSDVGTVSAAWMSGFASIGAQASQCGIPTLQLDRGDSDTGEAAVIIMKIEYLEVGLAGLLPPSEEDETNTDSDAEATPEPFADLERRFCRTSIDDIYSWTLPLMALNAEGVHIADLDDVQEFEDYTALVDGIINGDCAVIGLPLTVWEEMDDAGEIPEDTVFVVLESPEVPHNVMVFPFAAALEVIEPITDALLAIDVAAGRAEAVSSDAEATAEPVDITVDADLMEALFGEGSFVRAQDADFAELLDFVNSSGLDLGQLGQ